MLIDDHLLKQIAPHARDDYISAFLSGGEVFERWGINSQLRMASFLATVCHETGALTIVRENTGWTRQNLSIFSSSRRKKILPFVGNKVKEANAAYGDRLGNQRDGTDDDDGFRYRGGGLIQLTGRDSYERAGKAIGVDLGNHPELIEDATVSLQAACWEFSQYLQYSDMGERGWKAVCNGINRGNPASKYDPIGWDDRQIWYLRCCDAIGISSKVKDDLLRIGDRGELVKAMQARLRELGYAIGSMDGIFGPRTRAAVLAFQAENDLTTDGIIGPATRAALNAESAKSMPVGDRANDTLDDLHDKGSRITEKASKGIKAVATVGIGSVTYAAAQAADALTGAGETLKEIQSLKTLTIGFTEIMSFFGDKWYLIAVLISYVLYKIFSEIQSSRLEDHQEGRNLAR